jgi:hypothetical protein
VFAFEADIHARLASLDAEGKPEQDHGAQHALSIARKLEIGAVQQAALLVIGQASTVLGNWRRAEENLLRLARIAARAGDQYAEGKATAALGTLFARKHLAEGGSTANRRARRYLRKSIAVFKALGASIDLQAAEDELTAITGSDAGPQAMTLHKLTRALPQRASPGKVSPTA